MAEIEVVLPKMGESVAEATVTSWLKNEGDSVEAEESIIEIATDKVDSEVPSPAEGVLVKKLFNDGDVVKVGEVIAIISTDGDVSSPSSGGASSETANEDPVKEVLETVSTPLASISSGNNGSNPITKNGQSGRFYSPLVRNIAKTEGITMNELESISGSGQGNRVTKADILAYIENRGNATIQSNNTAIKSGSTVAKKLETASNNQANTNGAISIKQPAISIGGSDEIVEMDRMRKLIADHMVMSKHVSPHVTSYVEADVTNIVNWRNRMKNEFLKREGEKLTFTPIFIEAIAKAIKDMPDVNVSVDGNKIVKRGNINVGMATALPSGNLIVPVIKNADRLNLLGLAKTVNDLANRARNNKLLPDEIQGGTYTVTNVGTFGNVMGTPIINQPQVAIMAVGAIRKKPAVIETPQGDTLGIRHMMFLSHAYDHRVVDGALGGSFVRKVADYLEAFDPNREI